MNVVYGIKNCDTVKRALKWLDAHQVEYTFHDFKTKGISDATLRTWSGQVGWDALLNKKGLTWKQLPKEVQESIKNEKAAFALMKEKTSVIKRPVVERDGKIIAQGFSEAEYAALWK